jgi:hypothetical protein
VSTAKRLARILFAYALSAFVTGYVVWASLFWDDKVDASMRDPTSGLFIAFLVAWFAAVPSGLAVLLGEAKRWRMPWYYSAAGSLIGLALGTLFNSIWFFPWLGLGFGVGSGAIYWTIAGRRAGAEHVGERRVTLIAVGLVVVVAAVFTLPLMTGLR